MPAETGKGFPYVQPADAVADYPTTSQLLAQKIDDHVPGARAGGAATTSASGSVAVTFPVGRFATSPRVTLGIIASALPTAAVWQAYVTGATPTGFTLRAHRSDSLSGAVMGVNWYAETD
jgi:hypothetical protein